MTNGEAVNWLINLTADIGKAEHSDLWHYEQALYEIRELLEFEPHKGKWIAKTDIVSYWACSECLAVAMRDDYGQQVLTDYCSCCGARMEKP